MTDQRGFPLHWPAKRERTPAQARQQSAFGPKSITVRVKDLLHEIKLLGGVGTVISSNQPRTKEGLINGAAYALVDPGVAVYFTMPDLGEVQFACDRWETLQENMRAIALHLASMRGQERWGVGTTQMAFKGYSTALVKTSVENWRLVFGLPRFGTVTRTDVQKAYAELAALVHPDKGGTPEAMARLNVARDEAFDWLTANGG